MMNARSFVSKVPLALLVVCGTLSPGGVLTRAASVDFIVDESDILSWTGDTDTDPRGLALLGDGRFVFFEDEPGAGAAEDAVVLVDPSRSGVDRFSVIASEDQLLALAPNGTRVNVHVSDIVRDPSDNLYLLATERSSGNFDNYVVKIPFDGVQFEAPLLVTDVFDGGDDGSGRVQHRLEVDPLRDRIYILYDDLNPAGETDRGAGSNGVYTFDLGDSPGTTADLSVFASYVDIGAAVTPPVDNGNEDMGLWQIRADSQGHLYGVHSSGTGDNDGDIVRISAVDGSTTLFLDQFEAEYATGNLHQFRANTNLAIHPGNDHLYLFETGTTIEQRENVYEFDPAGNLVRMVVAHDQIVDELPQAGPTFTTTSTNPIVVDPAGNVFFFLHNSSEIIVAIDSDAFCAPGAPLSFIWPTGTPTPPDPSSPFGPRQLVSGAYRYDWHRGVDIAMPIGTDLVAVADGVVEDAGALAGFAEPVVILRHGDCPPYVYSYYLHLSSVQVVKEQAVVQGQKVGDSGASASGFAHLHYETRFGCNSQSCNRNPYEFLPYLDEAPPLPALTGANSAGDQTVLLLDFSAPDSQIDLNGISVDWGADSVLWNWTDSTRANSPSTPSALDRPVIDLGAGVYAVAFPDHMNESSSAANYRLAVAGLEAGVLSGSATLNDIHGPGPAQSLSLSAHDVTVCPAALEVGALPGETIHFDHSIRNTGSTGLEVTLTAQSAQNNSVSLSESQFSLAAGELRVVTITVTLDASHPPGTGDGVLLRVDPGNGPPVIALDTACADATCLQPLPAPCPNVPPVAQDQSLATDAGTALPVTLTATDVEGDPLTFEVVDPPVSGTLTGTAPDLVYTPDLDFSEADSFTFVANDGSSDSNLGTVSIVVEPLPTVPITLASDGFESGDFSGGAGWTTNWSASGDVRVRDKDKPHSGSYHVRLRGGDGYLERGVDLSDATAARLRFWAKVRSFESSDQAYVKVSEDGVNFTTLLTLTSNESDNEYHVYDLDLSAFLMTSTFRIAFDGEMSSKHDQWYVDDIEVIGIPGSQ